MCSHGATIPLPLGCPAIALFITHLLCCYPQTALLFTLLCWSPHSFPIPLSAPIPFPFCCDLQSPEVNTLPVLPGAPMETICPTNLCSTGGGASRAAGQFHGHIRSHQAQSCPQVQEDCQQNYCTKTMMNTVLWESGGATISGAALGPLLPWEALRRPWNT